MLSINVLVVFKNILEIFMFSQHILVGNEQVQHQLKAILQIFLSAFCPEYFEQVSYLCLFAYCNKQHLTHTTGFKRNTCWLLHAVKISSFGRQSFQIFYVKRVHFYFTFKIFSLAQHAVIQFVNSRSRTRGSLVRFLTAITQKQAMFRILMKLGS